MRSSLPNNNFNPFIESNGLHGFNDFEEKQNEQYSKQIQSQYTAINTYSEQIADEDVRFNRPLQAESCGTYLPKEMGARESYPIDVFPAEVQDYIRQIGSPVDADPAIAGTAFMGFTAASIQLYYAGMFGGLPCPGNNFFIALGPTSSGKRAAIGTLNSSFSKAVEAKALDEKDRLTQVQNYCQGLQLALKKTREKIAHGELEGTLSEHGYSGFIEKEPGPNIQPKLPLVDVSQAASVEYSFKAMDAQQENAEKLESQKPKKTSSSKSPQKDAATPKNIDQLASDFEKNVLSTKSLKELKQLARELQAKITLLGNQRGFRFFYNDMLPVAMQDELIKNGKSGLLFATEKEPLYKHFGCTKTKRKSELSLLCAAWNGESTVASRITREGMEGAFCISIVAAVQPDFFETLPDSAFTDGAVARVLWVLARGRGAIDHTVPPFSSDWLDKYARSTVLFNAQEYVRPNGQPLNDLAPYQATYREFNGVLAEFAPAASSRLQDYANETKAEGDRLERVPFDRKHQTYAKAPEHVSRVALALNWMNFHCQQIANPGNDAPVDLGLIGLETVEKAIKLVNWHIGEFLRLVEKVNTTVSDVLLKVLANKFEEYDEYQDPDPLEEKFSIANLLNYNRGLRNYTREELENALDALVTENVLRVGINKQKRKIYMATKSFALSAASERIKREETLGIQKSD